MYVNNHPTKDFSNYWYLYDNNLGGGIPFVKSDWLLGNYGISVVGELKSEYINQIEEDLRKLSR